MIRYLQKGGRSLKTAAHRYGKKVALLGALLMAHKVAFADDILAAAGAFNEVKDNFGPGSNFALISYAVEIIFGIYLFSKSKNPLVFACVVAVVIFTAIAWKTISPTA